MLKFLESSGRQVSLGGTLYACCHSRISGNLPKCKKMPFFAFFCVCKVKFFKGLPKQAGTPNFKSIDIFEIFLKRDRSKFINRGVMITEESERQQLAILDGHLKLHKAKAVAQNVFALAPRHLLCSSSPCTCCLQLHCPVSPPARSGHPLANLAQTV